MRTTILQGIHFHYVCNTIVPIILQKQRKWNDQLWNLSWKAIKKPAGRRGNNKDHCIVFGAFPFHPMILGWWNSTTSTSSSQFHLQNSEVYFSATSTSIVGFWFLLTVTHWFGIFLRIILVTYTLSAIWTAATKSTCNDTFQHKNLVTKSLKEWVVVDTPFPKPLSPSKTLPHQRL